MILRKIEVPSHIFFTGCDCIVLYIVKYLHKECWWCVVDLSRSHGYSQDVVNGAQTACASVSNAQGPRHIEEGSETANDTALSQTPFFRPS
jgi:hypothetical protein